MRFSTSALVALTLALSTVHAGHLRRYHRHHRRNLWRPEVREVGTPVLGSHPIESLPLPLPNRDQEDDGSSPSTNAPTKDSTTLNVTSVQSSLSRLTADTNKWIANTTANEAPLSIPSVTQIEGVFHGHDVDMSDFIYSFRPLWSRVHLSPATELKLADMESFVTGFEHWTRVWVYLSRAGDTSSKDAIAILQQDITRYENDMSTWLGEVNAPASISSVPTGGMTVSVAPITETATTLSKATVQPTSAAAKTSGTGGAGAQPFAAPSTAASTPSSMPPSTSTTPPAPWAVLQRDVVAEPPSTPSAPPNSIQSGTTSECNKYYRVETGDGCEGIAAKFGISKDDFYKWNTDVGGTKCSKLLKGDYVCVGVPGSSASAASTAAPSGAASAAPSSAVVSSPVSAAPSVALLVAPSAAPSAAPSGAASTVLVVTTSVTSSVASPASPSVVSLSVPSPTASSTAPTAAPLSIPSVVSSGPSSTVPDVVTSLPPSAPIQAGLAQNCDKFYQVSSGQTCNIIRGAIPLSDILTWNSAVNADCTNLIAGDYICVGVPGSPTFTPPGSAPSSPALPTALPPGTVPQPPTNSTAPQNSTFDPKSDSALAVYYGNTEASGSIPLSTLCNKSPAIIIILDFVDKFFAGGNLPSLNLGPLTGGVSTHAAALGAADLKSVAPTIPEGIKTCQSMGKVVLLSLGGESAAGEYGPGGPSTSAFSSSDQAETFAQNLWDLFGGGKNASLASARPFGDVKIDGFDIDNESHQPNYYQDFTSALRRLYGSDPSKPYYISAAPQCPRPDASIPLSAMLMMDFVWPQFYNNGPCNANETGFAASFKAWSEDLGKGKGGSGPTKVFVGAPSYSKGGVGWQAASSLAAKVKEVKVGIENFGGVMLWDGAEGMAAEGDFLGTVARSLGGE